MGKISLNNISVIQDDYVLLDKISFNMSNGNNLSIIGPGGVGKTTLAKVLDGSLKYDGLIKINGVELVKSNLYLLKRYISVVLNDKYSNNRLIIDELFDSLNGLNLSAEDEKNRVNTICDFFDLKLKLQKKVSSFTVQYKSFLKIIMMLVKKPEYIVFDDVLVNLEVDAKEKVFLYCKDQGITVINITSEIEETIYSDYMICLYNKKIAMEGKTLECYKEEKLLRRLGFNLPFYVDLSIQLGYYGLLDKVILNQKEMVKEIWK